MTICQVCQKKPGVGYNKPHSLHRTKRTIKPNLQKVQGKNICARCMRTGLLLKDKKA